MLVFKTVIKPMVPIFQLDPWWFPAVKAGAATLQIAGIAGQILQKAIKAGNIGYLIHFDKICELSILL